MENKEISLYGDSQSLIKTINTSLQENIEKSVAYAQEQYENTLQSINKRQDDTIILKQMLTLMIYENNVKLKLDKFNPEITTHLVKMLADNEKVFNGVRISYLIQLLKIDKAASVITDILFYFTSQSAAKEKPSHEDLLRIAALIVNRFPDYCVTDIIYGMQNGVIGKYGELFNKIDGASIVRWVSVPAQERQDKIDAQHELTKERRYDKLVSPDEVRAKKMDDFKKQILEKTKIIQDAKEKSK